MTPILEQAELGSDLDCQNFVLRNVLSFSPVPTGLASVGDALDGPRTVLNDSVLNEHVHVKADIDQTKLNLNGAIPPVWMVGPIGEQPEFPYAAQGNLAEFVSRKGAISGYAGLDANGRLASGNVNTGAATGTVSAVKLVLVPELTVTPGVIESSGVFDVSWVDTVNNSWFGVYAVGLNPGGAQPKFQTDMVPVELIPDLDATKFTDGTFPVEQLPVAIGMSFDHRQGIVPDPGPTGDPDEYLGRDIKWHRFDKSQTYQPTAPQPTIVFTPDIVRISCSLKKSVIFYRVAPSADTSWSEAHPTGESFNLPVTGGQTVYAWSAKAGYNNSPTTFFIVPFGLAGVIEEEPPPI